MDKNSGQKRAVHYLYPPVEPFDQRVLDVGDGHSIYVEQSGNPSGLPVVVVHGGPGGGSSPAMRRYFDPNVYRVILFDQRGCGHSRPHAEVENNTSWHLVADMEQIREVLKVKQWVIFGGSWGSTLALLYAQAHKERVLGLILRGIFLCRQQDFHWLFQEGASHIFPDYWEDFLKPIPPAERKDLISSYYRHLTGPNELAKMAAAKAWSLWEGRCATLKPSHKVVESFSDPHKAVSLARIEAHYFVNGGFIEENQIIDNADKLADIPGIIVHGRYDMVCTMENAHTLHRHWPGSQLQIVRDAGHSSSEPGTVDALIRATRDMAQRFEYCER